MSCLFNSIGRFLNIDGHIIRNIICDYLETNRPILEGIDTKIILETEDTNYIQKMRNPAVFGGANEIRVACILWNLKIVVFLNNQLSENIEFVPLDGKYKFTIHLWYQNNNHYEPLIMRSK